MNHIVFRLKRSKKGIWIEPYCLLVNIFLKGYLGTTILSFGQNFRKRQCGLNHIVFWSDLLKKTVWVDPCYLLVRTFEKSLNLSSKTLSWRSYHIAYAFWTKFVRRQVKSKKKIFCENHQKNYKKQYRSNCVVLWSKYQNYFFVFLFTEIVVHGKSAEPGQIRLIIF